jgi:SAM-dependent methyltransferase
MPKPSFKLDKYSAVTAKIADEALYGNTDAAEPAKTLVSQGHLMLALELAHSEFKRDVDPEIIVARLAKNLHELRRDAGPAVWKALIPVAQQHPVSEYLQQDPFTKWSFEKPRGYSGDATLLDIYYQHKSADDIIAQATELGREIYHYTSNADSSVAGRERCEILTDYVDKTAAAHPNAEILSIACGHLREAEKSEALKTNSLKRWVALDQDPQSLATVRHSNPGNAVQPVEGSVRGLLGRKYDLGQFDLVYASGLYDYLTVPIGVRLMQRCWDFVRPGGKFLFANFSDEIKTDGYMETFMDWPLILRNGSDMEEIVNGSVDRNSIDLNVFYGSNRNIVYAEVTKLA